MSRIRILKVYSPYLSYIRQVYSRSPFLEKASYLTQLKHMNSGFFAWGDGWKVYLEETGRYNVEEVVMNAEYLQKQWAREHHVNFNEQDWKFEILEAQIVEFKPDIWLSLSAEITPDFRTRIRRKYPCIKYVIGYDGVCNHDPAFFEGCDTILSCLENTVDYYRENGFNGYFFQHAFDPRIVSHLKHREPLFDVSFIGGVTLSRQGHNERLKLLTQISKDINIDLWLSDVPTTKRRFRTACAYLRRGQLGRLYRHLGLCRDIPAFLKHAKDGLYGLDMYQALADSRIALNTHIDVAEAKAGNMRLFEATGTGACLVTDWKENLGDYFELDKEVIAYHHPEECIEKIDYLLKNEDVRQSVAHLGQKKTLQKHSLKSRILEFEEDVILSI